MSQAEIGLIGLGVMGSNLALNIAEKGNKIAVFNRTVEATHKVYAEAGELKGQIVACDTIEAFVAASRPPRPIIMMIKAGEPVDHVELISLVLDCDPGILLGGDRGRVCAILLEGLLPQGPDLLH